MCIRDRKGEAASKRIYRPLPQSMIMEAHISKGYQVNDGESVKLLREQNKELKKVVKTQEKLLDAMNRRFVSVSIGEDDISQMSSRKRQEFDELNRRHKANIEHRPSMRSMKKKVLRAEG